MKKTLLINFIIAAFLINTLGPVPFTQAQELRLPNPGVMISLSPTFNPPVLKGVTIYPNNPFKFDFILDKGDNSMSSLNGNKDLSSPNAFVGDLQKEQLKQESSKLVKYFLASITTPENDLWVNLSPYEKNRIIPQSFGKTDMGRDLLGEDYILKQITASLIYPEGKTGKKFWKRVYEEAAKRYGTTNISVNTFNKVWIVPDQSKVYEHGNTAFVIKARLKVMLEEDYLALEKNTSNHVILSAAKDLNKSLDSSAAPQNDVNRLGSNIVREIVIPQLEKEVNEGQNFATLRQVYNSLILAVWFKKRMKDSILGQKYMNQNKVSGIYYNNSVILSKAKDLKITKDSSALPQNDVEAIYQRYLKAFKRGVYNYIKEEPDPTTGEMIPRKYFSGGVELSAAMTSIGKFNFLTQPETHAILFSKNLLGVHIQLKNSIRSSISAKAVSRVIIVTVALTALAAGLWGMSALYNHSQRQGRIDERIKVFRLTDGQEVLENSVAEREAVISAKKGKFLTDAVEMGDCIVADIVDDQNRLTMAHFYDADYESYRDQVARLIGKLGFKPKAITLFHSHSLRIGDLKDALTEDGIYRVIINDATLLSHNIFLGVESKGNTWKAFSSDEPTIPDSTWASTGVEHIDYELKGGVFLPVNHAMNSKIIQRNVVQFIAGAVSGINSLSNLSLAMMVPIDALNIDTREDDAKWLFRTKARKYLEDKLLLKDRLSFLRSILTKMSTGLLPEVIMFGDKHAKAEDLRKIRNKAKAFIEINKSNSKKLVIVGHGDYFDRGNDNVEVFQILKELKDLQALHPGKLDVRLLWGNHDIMLMNAVLLNKGNARDWNHWMDNGGGTTVNNFKIAGKPLDDLAKFMLDNFRLFYQDEWGMLHVHGGFPVDIYGNPVISRQELYEMQRELNTLQKEIITFQKDPSKHKELADKYKELNNNFSSFGISYMLTWGKESKEEQMEKYGHTLSWWDQFYTRNNSRSENVRRGSRIKKQPELSGVTIDNQQTVGNARFDMDVMNNFLYQTRSTGLTFGHYHTYVNLDNRIIGIDVDDDGVNNPGHFGLTENGFEFFPLHSTSGVILLNKSNFKKRLTDEISFIESQLKTEAPPTASKPKETAVPVKPLPWVKFNGSINIFTQGGSFYHQHVSDGLMSFNISQSIWIEAGKGAYRISYQHGKMYFERYNSITDLTEQMNPVEVPFSTGDSQQSIWFKVGTGRGLSYKSPINWGLEENHFAFFIKRLNNNSFNIDLRHIGPIKGITIKNSAMNVDKLMKDVPAVELSGSTLLTENNIDEIIEEPLRAAVRKFYELNIMTLMSNGDKNAVNSRADLGILRKSLSPDNWQIALENGGRVTNFNGEDAVYFDIPVYPNTKASTVEKHFLEIAKSFTQQEFLGVQHKPIDLLNNLPGPEAIAAKEQGRTDLTITEVVGWYADAGYIYSPITGSFYKNIEYKNKDEQFYIAHGLAINSAMSTMVKLKKESAPGGIDLTANRMHLEVESDKSMVSQPMNLKALENIEIDGLYIKDIEVGPVKNLPELLGIHS